MTDVYTASFEKWGYRELAEAARILHVFAEDGQPDFLSDGITLNFNTNSGKVFMSDNDYNVAVLEDEHLVQFYNCAVCGNEGTQEEGKENGWDFEYHNGFCSQRCEDENEGR